jgi:hypothetical protein
MGYATALKLAESGAKVQPLAGKARVSAVVGDKQRGLNQHLGEVQLYNCTQKPFVTRCQQVPATSVRCFTAAFHLLLLPPQVIMVSRDLENGQQSIKRMTQEVQGMRAFGKKNAAG